MNYIEIIIGSSSNDYNNSFHGLCGCAPCSFLLRQRYRTNRRKKKKKKFLTILIGCNRVAFLRTISRQLQKINNNKLDLHGITVDLPYLIYRDLSMN